MRSNYLGIDLGGTEVKLAIVDKKGKILEQDSFPNSCPSDPKKVVKNIITLFKKMKNRKSIKSTGIGVAGDVDQEKGVVRFSPNLKWKNIKLLKLLKPSLPNPIIIDNDANAAAWGAYWLETKGRARNLLCITLGTGIGGGIVFNGKLYHGASGTAGEIGHVTLVPHGLRCNCGNKGCIERYLGANYLVAQAKEKLKKNRSKIIENLTNGNIENISPKILAKAANRGDKISKNVWKVAGERLGTVLASIVNLLNPEIIVLAGGVSKAGSLLLKPIKETIKKNAFATSYRNCRILL
ncbi:MAG: ROK family protein, partial [Endomicrobiales bacterium]|nr:ROK family protein [Endomicrobiales bacterium]